MCQPQITAAGREVDANPSRDDPADAPGLVPRMEYEVSSLVPYEPGTLEDSATNILRLIGKPTTRRYLPLS
jgi:hypothetical protein